MVHLVKDKTAILGAYSNLVHYLKKYPEKEVKFLHDAFLTFPVVIYTRKNFPLLQAFDEKIKNLNSAGLINLWYQKSLQIKARVKEPESPKKLTFHHLLGSFQILALGLLISLIVFIWECFYVGIRRKIHYTN